MATKDIITSEASREMMPKALQHSNYYAGNDISVQSEYKLKQEIAELAKEYDPAEVEFCRRFAQGESKTAIAKSLGNKIKSFEPLISHPVRSKLLHFFLHLRILQGGMDASQRMAMAERIARDNEKTDPDTALKALNLLHNMSAQRNPGGGGFTIVINGVDVKKGPLDG